jgi:putative transposase
VVGVDLGVTSPAVLSTGEIIANPRHLEVAQRELRRL